VKFLPILLLLLCTNICSGQVEPDSIDQEQLFELDAKIAQASIVQDTAIVTDSLKSKKGFFLKRWLVEDYPNPKKGLLIGLVVPGAGQIYNGSLWKVPLVYGAYGTVLFLISENSRQFNIYRDAVVERLDDDLTDDFVGIYTDISQLRTIRDDFQKNKEFAYFALIGVAILSVAEAFVDGHCCCLTGNWLRNKFFFSLMNHFFQSK